MKSIVDKEKEIRALISEDAEYKMVIISTIASCMSSNKGGESERLLEIGIVLRMIDSIRLYDLAKYVASHQDDVDGDTIFNLWWVGAQNRATHGPDCTCHQKGGYFEA